MFIWTARSARITSRRRARAPCPRGGPSPVLGFHRSGISCCVWWLTWTGFVQHRGKRIRSRRSKCGTEANRL